MFCPACRTPQAEGERYCTGCGGEFARMTAVTGKPQAPGKRWQNLLLGFVGAGVAALLVQNLLLLGSVRRLVHGGAARAGVEAWQSGADSETGEMPATGHVRAESPGAEIVFMALKTPCGRCNNRTLAENDCDHPQGAVESKRLINRMFAEGKSKKEVIGHFVSRYGEEILTPQARAIYRQQHPQGKS